MPNKENLISGQGRVKGSLNRKTIERTEILRDYLVKHDLAFKLLNLMLVRIETNPSAIKTSDIIKAFTAIAQPNLFYTINEQETAERLEQILSPDNPEQMKAEILDFVTALKAVNG